MIRRKDHDVVTTIMAARLYSAGMRFLLIMLLAIGSLTAGPYLTASGVYINGHGPYRFLVDTGAQTTSVSNRVAQAARIAARYRVEQVTVVGSRLTAAGLAARICAGNTTVTEVEVLIGGTPALPEIDGILGQSFLARVDYLLDYKSGAFLLDPDPATLRGTSLPFEWLNGRPAIQVTVGNKNRTLILDSGTPALVLFDTRPMPAGLPTGFVQTNAGSAAISLRSERIRVGEGRAVSVGAVYLPGRSPDRRASGLLPGAAFDWVYVNNTERFVMLSSQ